HIGGVEQNRGIPVVYVAQLMEREIGELQSVVGAAARRRADQRTLIRGRLVPDALPRGVCRAQLRVELVLGAAVRAGLEVATGAGEAVTAGLLIPEERFAQDFGGLYVRHKLRKV